MKILVIGGGGREHALAWKLAQSPRVSSVYVAPGNVGTAHEPGVINVALTAIDELVDFARTQAIALTVVGPEAPLAAGIVDAFRTAGLRIFGPTRNAARLESSKEFAKAFMARHDIPTARYRTFTEAAAARAYISSQGAPIVIKADGLAAGKGVVVASTVEQAHAAVDAMLVENMMGEAGARIVVEECLVGEEASFIAMVDGEHILPLASSQDHKRLRDGDTGPNTGGMGAYSPAPVVTPELHARIMREIINPAVAGMAAEGHLYTGFLYAGVMVDGGGVPRTLEFNCRMGDPEAQAILVRLKSDLFELLDHAIDGTLDAVEAQWDRRIALGVVLAAADYPEAPQLGAIIRGFDDDMPDVKVFHAGTREVGQTRADVGELDATDETTGKHVMVAGGRVLCVTALGDSVRQAQRSAYAAISRIHFDGMQFRSDIGHRALASRRT